MAAIECAAKARKSIGGICKKESLDAPKSAPKSSSLPHDIGVNHDGLGQSITWQERMFSALAGRPWTHWGQAEQTFR